MNPSAPDYEPWHHDPAHMVVDAWVAAWKTAHPGEGRPHMRFAAHLGRDARALQDTGTGRAQIQEIFRAHGTDGVCPCGMRADIDPNLIDRKESKDAILRAIDRANTTAEKINKLRLSKEEQGAVFQRHDAELKAVAERLKAAQTKWKLEVGDDLPPVVLDDYIKNDAKK